MGVCLFIFCDQKCEGETALEDGAGKGITEIFGTKYKERKTEGEKTDVEKMVDVETAIRNREKWAR